MQEALKDSEMMQAPNREEFELDSRAAAHFCI